MIRNMMQILQFRKKIWKKDSALENFKIQSKKKKQIKMQ